MSGNGSALGYRLPVARVITKAIRPEISAMKGHPIIDQFGDQHFDSSTIQSIVAAGQRRGLGCVVTLSCDLCHLPNIEAASLTLA